MADFEVVKVWIEPGCIVCDECENAAPDVFDVQQETCVVRPGAQYAGLQDAILEATTGCPVDVIRFETGDGQVATADGLPSGEEAEPEAEVVETEKASASATKAKPKKQVAADATVQGLLDTAKVTPGQSTTAGQAAGGAPAVSKPLAEVQVMSDWPADLRFAVLLGRPRRTLVKPEPEPLAAPQSGMSRRQFPAALAAAWAAFVASAAVGLGAMGRFFAPPYTPKKSPKFRAGSLDDYPEVGVYTQFKQSEQVWIVHLPDHRLVALSTICTHLGCTPSWLPNDNKFKCPCHGSGFRMTGINFEGPAPRPLPRYRIWEADSVLWVDKSKAFHQEKDEWAKPDSFLKLA